LLPIKDVIVQLFLIRHAQNEWVRTGKLAGWTPGVHLNDEGRKQADLLGKRLATAKLQALYSSPLERARETAQAIADHYDNLDVQIEKGIGEVDFGDWTGKRLRKLARTRLWKVVQHYPSGARFPGGESFLEVQFRLIKSIEEIASRHATGRVALVAHSDVIKLVVTHYAGVHLDLFQRFVISPASISIITLNRLGPRIIRINDTAHYDLAKDSES
jgi:probable phosphomutase (TIGR03848 family)